MMKSILSILVLGLSVMAFGAVGSPLVQSAGAKGNLAQACQPDIQKYCSDVTQGGGRIIACLRAHDDKLSTSCSKQWTQAKTQIRQKIQELHAACSGDVQKFCGSSLTPGEIGSCLSSHSGDLSASCKNFREENKMTG